MCSTDFFLCLSLSCTDVFYRAHIIYIVYSTNIIYTLFIQKFFFNVFVLILCRCFLHSKHLYNLLRMVFNRLVLGLSRIHLLPKIPRYKLLSCQILAKQLLDNILQEIGTIGKHTTSCGMLGLVERTAGDNYSCDFRLRCTLEEMGHI